MNITIRKLTTYDDLKDVGDVEKEVWSLSDRDVLPLAVAIAFAEAGNLWLGAFDGPTLAGFAFAFFSLENGHPAIHSHMLAVREPYREHNLGFKLKHAQRDYALAAGIRRITWTFDPLQSKNAHFNFAKLGAVSDRYKIDFYGPGTSSLLHRNGTDRLWLTWALNSRRVEAHLQGKDNRSEALDALSALAPLVAFNGSGHPLRSDLGSSLARRRIAIEIPVDINSMQKNDPTLAREWRDATQWAFTQALQNGFFVAEFSRNIRGQQGPGVYLLEKGTIEDYIPELSRS